MACQVIRNNRGIGLIAAVFVIVVVAMFGLLMARYLSTGEVSSIDDYLWTQAIYSADSAAQLRILFHDGGGNWGVFTSPQVNDFTTIINTDTFSAPGAPAVLRVQAGRLDIIREIEVKYVL